VEEMGEKTRIVLTTVIIRAAFAPFFAHIWDVNTLQIYSNYFVQGLNIYEDTFKKSLRLQNITGLPIFYEGYAYLPHAIMIFAPFYLAFLALGGNPLPILGVYDPAHPVKVCFLPDVYLFLLIIKLPMIIADALITLVLYKHGKLYAWLYALSPYSIFISSVWGMFDSIVALFLLFAIMCLEAGKDIEAGISYGISLMKLYTVYAFPVIAIAILRGRKLRSFLKFMFGLLMSQVPTFYYFLLDQKAFASSILLFHGTRFGGGMTPLNVLWCTFNLPFNVGVSRIVMLVSVGAWITSLFCAIKMKLPLREAILLTTMTGVFFGKIVNEQYLLSVYPILLLTAPKKARELEKYPIIFSMFNSTPIYFAIPLLSAIPQFRSISSMYYGALGAEEIFFISHTALFIIGTLFLLKIFLFLLHLLRSKQGYYAK
jgi:hypothetical protein